MGRWVAGNSVSRVVGASGDRHVHQEGLAPGMIGRGRGDIGTRRWALSTPPAFNIGGPTLDIREYMRIFRRSWILIAAVTLVGILIAAIFSALSKPTYTSETQLFVAIQSSGTVQELQQGNTFSQARVQSYVKTVTTPVVLQPVIDSLGLTMSAEELSRHVKAGTDANTVIVNISASNNSPAQAAAIAAAVATSLVETVESLEKPKTGGASPVNISVIKPATAPASPSAPNTRMNLLVGLILGLGTGFGLALVRGTFDRRVRGESDLRLVTDAPILGAISFDQDAEKSPLLTQTAAQSPRAEAFRQLRTNLQFANISGQAKTVLITSSLPGEGKSTTATNLAIALAQAGKSVCLIDADLRRPMVNEYLGLDRSAGLTTALVGSGKVDDLLQPWGEDNLYVLTSGVVPPNPSELLGSNEMQGLLVRLEEVFDTVIIDAPPLLPVTDAAVLSQYVGGVLLVVGTHRIRQPELERSLTGLNMVEANLLGVVLNRLQVKGPDAYSYSYYTTDESVKRASRRGAKGKLPARELPSSSNPSSVAERSDQYHDYADVRPSTKFPANRIDT